MQTAKGNMYSCINCGVETEELYRRYSSSVLKILKCEKCGKIADKYIEYDLVIVLIDIVLLEKPAYRHLLYNGHFKFYWKLMVILLLGESFRNWSLLSMNSPVSNQLQSNNLYDLYEREKNFYVVLVQTAATLGAFLCAIIVVTELKWLLFGKRPHRYKASDLGRALIVGGCAKLLGLVGIIWQSTSLMLHYTLIHGYTVLCLLTAYSVVCETGRIGSLIGLAGGLLAYNFACNSISEMPISFSNISFI